MGGALVGTKATVCPLRDGGAESILRGPVWRRELRRAQDGGPGLRRGDPGGWRSIEATYKRRHARA